MAAAESAEDVTVCEAEKDAVEFLWETCTLVFGKEDTTFKMSPLRELNDEVLADSNAC